MEKPITIARKEFMDKLVDLVNGAGLPAFIIADILAGCHKEVVALAEKQYNQDLEAYNQAKEAPEAIEPDEVIG